VKKFIKISYTILEKFKKLKILPICVLSLTKIEIFTVHRRIRIQDPDPDPGSGSGSEILDFQFEDPDQRLLISDPEP